MFNFVLFKGLGLPPARATAGASCRLERVLSAGVCPAMMRLVPAGLADPAAALQNVRLYSPDGAVFVEVQGDGNAVL